MYISLIELYVYYRVLTFLGVIVIISLQFFTYYFSLIPKASLAAVIIAAVVFMVEFHVLKPIWRSNSEWTKPVFYLFNGNFQEHGLEWHNHGMGGSPVKRFQRKVHFKWLEHEEGPKLTISAPPVFLWDKAKNQNYFNFGLFLFEHL